MSSRYGITAIALASIMLLPTGCTMLGYQLGRSLPADIRVVYVPIFENATGEPGLDAEMTRAAIQEFQREGSLSVADADRSDITLLVRLTDFSAFALRYETDSVTVGEEYRFRVRADVQLIRTTSGEEMFRKTMIGEADGELGGDIISAKARVMPDVAADLAYRIVTAVVEHW